MHCKACEMLIKQNVEEIKDCTIESVSFKSGTMRVKCNDAILPAVRSAIHEAGYTTTPPKGDTNKQTADAIVGKFARLLVAGVLIWIIMKTDVSSLIPAYENLTFSVAFLVGLVASISTCLAVT